MDYPATASGGSPFRSADPRASDADRDTTVDILCAAVADGRLTLAELEERTEAAVSARTLTELATLIADLSDPLPAPVPEARERAAPSARDLSGRRWALLQSIAAATRQPAPGLSLRGRV